MGHRPVIHTAAVRTACSAWQGRTCAGLMRPEWSEMEKTGREGLEKDDNFMHDHWLQILFFKIL